MQNFYSVAHLVTIDPATNQFVLLNSVTQAMNVAEKLDEVLAVWPYDIGLNQSALDLTKDAADSLDRATLQHFRIHFGFEKMPYRISCLMFSHWRLEMIKRNTKAQSQLMDRFDYGTGRFTDSFTEPELTIGAHLLKVCNLE